MNQMAVDMDIKRPEDWYNVQIRDVINNGGGGLLKYYGSSPRIMISNLIENAKFHMWMFRDSKSKWTSETISRFLEWAPKQLGLTRIEDWNQVTVNQFLSLGKIMQHSFYNDFRRRTVTQKIWNTQVDII